MGTPAYQQYPTPLELGDFDTDWRTVIHNSAGTGEGAVSLATLGQLRRITDTNASRTLSVSDAGAFIEMNNAAANTVVIPLNATAAIPIDTPITIVQFGAGQTTIDAVAGVTLNGTDGATRSTIARYESITLYKRGDNEWIALNV